jgi:4-nitrophenyl phosphatase
LTRLARFVFHARRAETHRLPPETEPVTSSAPRNPIDTYVFDLDGVVYLGDEPIPEAVTSINRLLALGKGVYYLTNNSSKTRADYQAKLAKMDIRAEPSHIYTSAYATALYLRDHGGAGKTAYVVGEQGVASELVGMGVTVTTTDERPVSEIDYVIVGIDRDFTYRKLRYAHACITQGRAAFIATNRDSTYPTETGPVPGAGSIVAAVATATNREPLTIGKPEPPALLEILKAAGTPAHRALMVGDRLDTDIAIGKRAGVPTALVLTGVTSRSELDAAPSGLHPDLVIGSLSELLENL